MSLSPSQIEIIKATAPVVAEHAEAITKRMYELLFSAHPQTKELFKDASPDQHKKLAQAIVAYASNIDNLGALGGAVEKMASRHVETAVQPEYYPMVGVAVLGAIKDVLGDAATDDILDAWKSAFFFLADILIAKEKALYAEAS